MTPLNVALVGMGRWGLNYLRLLSQQHNVSYVVNRSTAKFTDDLVGAHPDTAFITDLSTALKDDRIDSVFVITPAHTHYDIALKALEHGKHVFVEKPFTLNLEQAESLLRQADQVERVLMAGHIFYYTDACRRIREKADTVPLGRVTLSWRKFGTFHEPITRTLLPHDLYILLDLFGECQEWRVTNKECPLEDDRIDILELAMKFTGGATADILLDRTCEGEKHRAGEYHFNDHTVLRWDNHTLIGEDGLEHVQLSEPLKDMIDDFICRIESSSNCTDNERLACMMVSVVEDIEASLGISS
ncbi:MAG: hypothetical protein BMS9Abin26_0790 [Gammaproteobacteria bacterium]|nr:MAG: hypothetical protein BMS9Abin26_0790 [Gammaproteobacteria bacterium]